MNELTLQRVPFTKDADNKLRALKSRTGITPNILCRLGFCMSLELNKDPEDISGIEKVRDINRFTLLGEYEPVFVALLTVWKEKRNSPLPLDELLIRHMNRGARLASQNRVL